MPICSQVLVDLVPVARRVGSLPFGELLRDMLQAGLAPQATRAALERVNARLEVPLLRPQGVEDGGFLVEEQVLFPQEFTWWVLFQDSRERLTTSLAPEDVPAVAHLLRVASHAQDLGQIRAAWPFEETAWVERLVAPAPSGPSWPEPQGPGIYRREHASLLVRSRTSGLLLDPIALQRRLPNMRGVPANLRPEAVEAVAITHSHVDHWHLPSLLAHLARPEVPVLVPPVSRPNLLTFHDFAATLRTAGQAARAPAWGETVKVGDMEVDILPFYGEQPTREGPRLREGLRNWGSCYRLNTEDFSCAVLVDTGEDPEGNMVEVLAESCQRRGPVDVLLCCQREFLSPFFGGLAHYWAALPYAQLRALYQQHLEGRLRTATAGPAGAVELCAASQARYFLAYANGYEGLGQPITDTGWGEGEPSEAECNARMREALEHRGLSTQVLEWCPGDVARLERGQLRLERVGVR